MTYSDGYNRSPRTSHSMMPLPYKNNANGIVYAHLRKSINVYNQLYTVFPALRIYDAFIQSFTLHE